MNIFRFIALSLILICTCKVVTATEEPQIVFAGKQKKSPNKSNVILTTIKSKTIQLHRLKGEIEFLDNVSVEREDTSFLADKMIVYYYGDNNKSKKLSNEKKANSSSIKKIEAWDNVKIFQEEFIATGDTGSYDPAQCIFIVEKNVIFNDGASIAHGEKFIYDINSKKGYLAGSKKVNVKKIKEDGAQEDQTDNRATVIINNDEDLKDRNKNNKNK